MGGGGGAYIYRGGFRMPRPGTGGGLQTSGSLPRLEGGGSLSLGGSGSGDGSTSVAGGGKQNLSMWASVDRDQLANPEIDDFDDIGTAAGMGFDEGDLDAAGAAPRKAGPAPATLRAAGDTTRRSGR